VLQAMAAKAPPGGRLIIDLGVPPNVDPDDAEAEGIERFGMDSIIADATEGRISKLTDLADARLVVDDHLERLRREYAVREAAPMLKRLTTRYQAAAVESLRRLPGATREALGGDESLRTWAEGFARRMAHAPLKGLRALAAEAGPAAVQSYLRGIEEALADDDRDRAQPSGAESRREES